MVTSQMHVPQNLPCEKDIPIYLRSTMLLYRAPCFITLYKVHRLLVVGIAGPPHVGGLGRKAFLGNSTDNRYDAAHTECITKQPLNQAKHLILKPVSGRCLYCSKLGPTMMCPPTVPNKRASIRLSITPVSVTSVRTVFKTLSFCVQKDMDTHHSAPSVEDVA